MNIAVIGGGASGLSAAITASKNGANVTVFEANNEAGRKILKTGNGKCNITNMNLEVGKYHSDNKMFVENAISKYDNNDLIRELMGSGLLIKEMGGLVYPYNEQASAARDTLVYEALSNHVNIRTETYVNMIARDNNGFLISVEGQKEREYFDRVIIATGSKSGLTSRERSNGYNLLKGLGIESTALYPGLVRLECEGLDFDKLKGARAKAHVTLFIEDEFPVSEEGEILFWEKGVSGICVFQLSRFVNDFLNKGRELVLKIDLLPDMDEETLKGVIIPGCLLNPDKTVADYFAGIVNRTISDSIVAKSGLDENEPLCNFTNEDILAYAKTFKNLYVKVIGSDGFEASQVTVGGISLNDINENMEVKSVPGLYVVGELMNVDGPCGGYNLQWAFTSGHIAGESACS